MDAAAEAGTAFVFMGHGTSHTANVTYDQMQTQMENLGLKNAFIGTVEGKTGRYSLRQGYREGKRSRIQERCSSSADGCCRRPCK